MNPFTDHVRERAWDVGAKPFCAMLRAPSVLDFLKREAKPMTASVGDFVLTSCLNEYLMASLCARRYDVVYDTLVRVFPDLLTRRRNGVTVQ